MAISSSILVYGCDLTLLETRSWLLERAGFEVLQAKELSEAKQIVSTQSIHLLLLCHSLSVEDCQSILEAADTLQPTMKRLVMTANRELCSRGEAEPQLSAFAGSRALLIAVEEILADQRTPPGPV